MLAPTTTSLRLLAPRDDAPAGLTPLAVMDRPVEPMYLRPGSRACLHADAARLYSPLP